MAKTNQQRFDDTLTYVHQFISSELAQDITAALRQRSREEVGEELALEDDEEVDPTMKAKVGKELSIEGKGYWRHGSKNQHKAVRALVLCHQAFLRAPYALGTDGAPFNYNIKPEVTKPFFLKKNEEAVKCALRCYLTVPGATRAQLAQVATDIQNPQGEMTWETMTRDTDPFPTMRVCFDALKMWLFKAGFVSLRWLSQTGPGMTAQTVNAMLGDGIVIQDGQLPNMPSGYLFNFHRAGDKAVCHWGVSLGGGWAAGSNTQADWPGASAPVNFRSGGSTYGEFTLASSLEVCKHKYKQPKEPSAPMTIRQIDPTAVTTYF
jgi:hypothetical protein